MSTRNRRAALRAVQAAAEDAEGKLAGPLPESEASEPGQPGAGPTTADANGQPPSQAAAPPSDDRPAEPLEAALPEEWREKVTAAASAEAVEVHGERVRRRVDEEMVYLAVRVPRSLRDAVRQRADRLDVSMQEFVIRAAETLLGATARAVERDGA